MTIDIEAVEKRWKSARAATAKDRVAHLCEAITRFVEPGDTLYLGGTMARPNAALFEIARQFWKTDPRFTLVAPAIANQHAPVLQAGLFPKVITSIHASTYPTPNPHPIYNALAQSDTVVFENWSLLTLLQRVIAGALGLSHMPTGSLIGTDMAKELEACGGYSTVTDPFTGTEQPVVRALVPDVTILHGLAADPAGNILVCPPYYDTKWAALAAGRAVIATVETIVSPETIHRHSGLVQLPAERIDAVCEVPFGAHPNACPATLVPEVDGYPDDYAFLQDLRDAGTDPERLAEWAQEWIIGTGSHNNYLKKLGGERLHALRGKTAMDGWRFDLLDTKSDREAAAVTDQECHVVLSTRVLAEKLRSGAFEQILAGLGISSLAAWMAALRLREGGHVIPLMVEAGMYGYVPSPADPFLFNYRNMLENSMLSDVETILGAIIGRPGNRAIGVLGAAQIDRLGNFNTTRLPGLLLTGSGGANDIASGASEVLITLPHSSRRLVEAVDFITSPGHAVETIVTHRGVLERREGRFFLTAVVGDRKQKDVLIEEAVAKCGFELPVCANCRIEPPPTVEEVELARLLDPKGLFLE